MRPFDKFKEIDARLAALEAAIDALQLRAPIVDVKTIASATIAPPAAKRRGRPPKPA